MNKPIEIILENATINDYKEILGGVDIPNFGESVDVKNFGTITNFTALNNHCIGDQVIVFIVSMASSMAANWLYDKLKRCNNNRERKIILKIDGEYTQITYEKIEKTFKE